MTEGTKIILPKSYRIVDVSLTGTPSKPPNYADMAKAQYLIMKQEIDKMRAERDTARRRASYFDKESLKMKERVSELESEIESLGWSGMGDDL